VECAAFRVALIREEHSEARLHTIVSGSTPLGLSQIILLHRHSTIKTRTRREMPCHLVSGYGSHLVSYQAICKVESLKVSNLRPLPYLVNHPTMGLAKRHPLNTPPAIHRLLPRLARCIASRRESLDSHLSRLRNAKIPYAYGSRSSRDHTTDQSLGITNRRVLPLHLTIFCCSSRAPLIDPVILLQLF